MIYAPGLLHNILHLDNSTQLRRCRLQAYYTIALVITSRFQDNLRKSIPECQTSLGFSQREMMEVVAVPRCANRINSQFVALSLAACSSYAL